MYCPNCGREAQIDQAFCPHCGRALMPVVPTPGLPGQPAQAAAGIYEVASTGKRLANYFLDYFFQMIFTGILAGVAITADSSGAFMVLVIFSGIIYYSLFEGVWQRTPAKWITGTKVVMEDGTKPEFGKIFLRTIIRLIPFEPLSFLFSPIGWHDSWSKTLVVPADYTPEMVMQVNRKSSSKNTWLVMLGIALFLVLIIGIIIAVVFASLDSARLKSRDASRVSDIRQLETALELHYNDYQYYPASLQELVTKNYLRSIPTAPLPADGFCEPQENTYTYVMESDDFYSIRFCLGTNTGGFDEGVNQAVPVRTSSY